MKNKGVFCRRPLGSQSLLTEARDIYSSVVPARHLCPENLLSMQGAVDTQLRGLMEVNSSHVVHPPFVHRPEPSVKPQGDSRASRPLFLKAQGQ